MIRSGRGPELSAPILTPDNTAGTLACQGNTAYAAGDERSTLSRRAVPFREPGSQPLTVVRKEL